MIFTKPGRPRPVVIPSMQPGFCHQEQPSYCWHVPRALFRAPRPMNSILIEVRKGFRIAKTQTFRNQFGIRLGDSVEVWSKRVLTTAQVWKWFRIKEDGMRARSSGG
jgi:hypothetical protein